MSVSLSKLTCFLYFTCLFFSVLFCCTSEYAGGVETTNGLTIAVRKDQIQGTAPAGSQIVLCDTSYAEYVSFQPFIELFIDTAFADESGKFKFDLLPDGFYNLIGRNCNSDSGTIIKNISINRLNITEQQQSSQYLPFGSLTGTAYLDSNGIRSVLIFVMGTDLRDTTDRYGVYTIEKVPVSVYKITGSYCEIRPGLNSYFLSNVGNITVTGNDQTIRVDLNLEKIN